MMRHFYRDLHPTRHLELELIHQHRLLGGTDSTHIEFFDDFLESVWCESELKPQPSSFVFPPSFVLMFAWAEQEQGAPEK